MVTLPGMLKEPEKAPGACDQFGAGLVEQDAACAGVVLVGRIDVDGGERGAVVEGFRDDMGDATGNVERAGESTGALDQFGAGFVEEDAACAGVVQVR